MGIESSVPEAQNKQEGGIIPPLAPEVMGLIPGDVMSRVEAIAHHNQHEDT